MVSNPNDEPKNVKINEVQRPGETGNAIGNTVLHFARMFPMHAFVGDFPMFEAENLAIFNSIGFLNDAAGFAGERRVSRGIGHESTVRLQGIAN